MPAFALLFLAILIALPVTWLVSEFSQKRGLRITLGLLTLFAFGFCLWGFITVTTTFNYNAWYGGATGDLIHTALFQIEEGHFDRVLKVWRSLDRLYQPTYENRAKYRELVEDAARRMKGEVPIQPASEWDASVFTSKTWVGHWDDGYGYWIVINDIGQSFDVVQSGQPRAKVHSVSVSPDFTVLKFKEGDQWLHTLTLKNKYEASYEWFDLQKGTVWETRPIFKLIAASDEQKRTTQQGPAVSASQPTSADTNRGSISSH